MKTIDLESKSLDQSPPNNIPSQISKPHSDQTLQTSLIANDANNYHSKQPNHRMWIGHQDQNSLEDSLQTLVQYNHHHHKQQLPLYYYSPPSHFNLKNPVLLIEEVSELEDLETDELIGRMFEQIHQQHHQPGNPNAISSTSEKVDITNRTNLERFYILAPQEIFQNL
ncbi:hypothetical protein BY996DRAFT_6622742 [Phakopsora pachyrhizi]|nr:hypothetical protein BY996DRAFT_6622742 [Phakopsora pachyrhizi]